MPQWLVDVAVWVFIIASAVSVACWTGYFILRWIRESRAERGDG